MTRTLMPSRGRTYWTSRLLVVASGVGALGTLFLRPGGWAAVIADVLIRSYCMFVGTVMAHEGVHGHLGRSKAANFWWARWALLPTLVPYTNFRKTHRLHHQYTNQPGMDPDLIVRPRRAWEIPLRALAIPHHWFFWLRARGKLRGAELRELGLNYVGLFAAHGTLVALVGPERYLTGVLPALVLVSLLLWYPFAIKTHEGWSVGSPETRSHNYHGQFFYWFTWGLSVHRAHHMDPTVNWIDLRSYVTPRPSRRGWMPGPLRDVRVE